MEEKFFTPIDTLAKQSLPAIANHAPQIGLFAGSLELNTKAEKYNIFATPGEATPVCFERKETMAAFVRHLYTVATTGQDMTYQPTMRASEALKGCKVLVFYSNADLMLPDEATRLLLPNMSEYETANVIGAQVREHDAQIVIIDDATSLLETNPREAIALLNCVANVQGFMLLYGIDVTKATDSALNYIARHVHNLCQLTEGSVKLANDEAEPQAVNYFCFTYGRPTPQRIVYTIDEAGTVTIPPTPTTDIVRMQECGRLFAEKGINQATFADRTFGYYKGEFQKQTINSMISDAVRNGTLQRSGSGKKHTTIQMTDSPQQRKPYRGSIAIKCKLNPYNEKTGYSHAFEPVAYMGDFKLLAADGEGCKAATQWLTLGLIKTVITGERQLDFKIATTHRNTLVIVVGTDTTANGIKELVGEAKGATIDVISTNGTITDGSFLSLYRTSLNQYKPDFVFVINYDAIKQDTYTPTQLATALATVCKKGIVTIAQMNEWNGNEPMPTGNEFWNVKPLVDDETRIDFSEFDHNRILPKIYVFEANADGLQFLSRFKVIHGGLTLATGKEQKEALYRATFYWCDRTPRENICCDCTGKELTNSQISQAEKAGIIDVKKGKGYKDAIITYIGK